MKPYLRRAFSFALLLMFGAIISNALLTGTPLWGQTGGNSGQIVGQVLDASAAAVSGAEISIRNIETNFTRTTTTDSAGRFAVSLLPLGTYQVTARASNFETAAQEIP